MKKIAFKIIVLFALSIVSGNYAKAQTHSKKLNVNFNYSTTSCVDSVIKFTPNLNDNALAYYWVFENNANGTSNNQKSTHKFSTPGTYKVTLYVEDPRVYPDTLAGMIEKVIVIPACK